LASKVDDFHSPHDGVEWNPRTINDVEPTEDPMTLLAQRLEQMTSKFFQTKNPLMNKVTTIERDQQQGFPPRPQYNINQQPRGKEGWNPRPPNE